MSRRLRRLPVLLLPIVLGTTLVACGSDSGSEGSDGSSSSSSDALHGITITGDVGKAPEVKWNGELDVSKAETTVVTEGDGDKVSEGDQVSAWIWIGNGATQKQAYSSYDNGQTEVITADSSTLPALKDAVVGHTYGSRVATTTTAADLFQNADGNTQLGLGNKDNVLLIVDIIEPYVPPSAKDVPSAQMPSIVEKKGLPVSLDFTGLPEPKADDDLKRTVLKEGTGATVTTDMTISANYLGQVYGAKAPFDESFSKAPVEFALTGVVQGWTYGLEGLKVGSRVLLAIPPALGYGDQEQASIPANSTLYFVVDIVSAK